jgi:hypothetical protein
MVPFAEFVVHKRIKPFYCSKPDGSEDYAVNYDSYGIVFYEFLPVAFEVDGILALCVIVEFAL